MTTHINRAYFGVASAPGLGAIPVGAAVAGPYRSLGAAHDGASVDISIVDGSAWEIRTGCVYTHATASLSRGTLEDSSTGGAISLSAAAVVTVTATAGMGNRLDLQLNRGFVSVRNGGGVVQNLAANAATRIAAAFSTVDSDALGWWDATNKRFRPTKPGRYLCTAAVQLNSGAAGLFGISLSRHDYSTGISTNDTVGIVVNGQSAAASSVYTVSGPVALDGINQAVEVYVYASVAVPTSPAPDNEIFKAIYLGP